MNPLRKAYYIFRYLGPRFIWRRGGIYLQKRLGTQRRTYAPLPWEQIDFANITLPGTPSTTDAYAAFKRQQLLPFLFPLGEPPSIPDHIRDAAGERQPPLV